MKADGLHMDRMTYGVLIFLYSRRGDWDACLRVGDDMEEVNNKKTHRYYSRFGTQSIAASYKAQL